MCLDHLMSRFKASVGFRLTLNISIISSSQAIDQLIDAIIDFFINSLADS